MIQYQVERANVITVHRHVFQRSLRVNTARYPAITLKARFDRFIIMLQSPRPFSDLGLLGGQHSVSLATSSTVKANNPG